MIRFARTMVLALGCALAGFVGAQTPVHSAHSDDPLSTDSPRANPYPTSPPLADPLRQQAVTDPSPPLATPAVQFIMQASMDGLTKVTMAQIAVSRSQTPAIRQFARHLVAEHQSMNTTLGALALKRGTSVANVLDTDHASSVDQLRSLSGRAFDTAYVKRMVAAHDQALGVYASASSLSDLEVAQFASRALPTLRTDQSAAKALQSGIAHSP